MLIEWLVLEMGQDLLVYASVLLILMLCLTSEHGNGMRCYIAIRETVLVLF